MRNTKIVVPAQAGTQTPQRLDSINAGEIAQNCERQG